MSFTNAIVALFLKGKKKNHARKSVIKMVPHLRNMGQFTEQLFQGQLLTVPPAVIHRSHKTDLNMQAIRFSLKVSEAFDIWDLLANRKDSAR